MRTTEICNTDSEILYLGSNPLPTHKTASRQTWLVIRMQYCDYWSEEWGDSVRYAHGHGKMYGHCPLCLSEDGEPDWCSAEPLHFELLAVNPGVQTKKTIEWIETSWCLEWKTLSLEAKIQALVMDGVHATLWQASGLNKDLLMKRAEEELAKASVMGGFMLDAPQNAIGSSGWDFLTGDITRGLRR
jgi:hypothetical protein